MSMIHAHMLDHLLGVHFPAESLSFTLLLLTVFLRKYIYHFKDLKLSFPSFSLPLPSSLLSSLWKFLLSGYFLGSSLSNLVISLEYLSYGL